MTTTKTVPVEDLILDYNLYPRTDVSDTHVHRFMDVMGADDPIPPIQVQKATNRVIDGFHRVTASKRLGRDTIEALVIDCDDQQAFRLAVEANKRHGRPFAPYDYRKIAARCTELGITHEATAELLSVTPERLEQITSFSATNSSGEAIPLKRTIGHMRGHKLNKRQQLANERLGGMPALFYVRQLKELLTANLWHWENELLGAEMEELVTLWQRIRAKETA